MPNTRKHIRDVCQVSTPRAFVIGVAAGGLYAWVAPVLVAPGLIGTEEAWSEILFHLFVSGVVGLAYSSVFRSARRSGVRIGLVLGVCHFIISGIVAGLITSHGFFLHELGLAALAAYFLAHLVFGATVGFLFDFSALRDEYPVPITERLDASLR